jgi:NAD(P)-dependent dehydrogenase (short-subunit alcohol dehydrogenase family)
MPIPLTAVSKGEGPALNRMEGKRVLVVGAGTADYGLVDPPLGIGRAIALALGSEGAMVGCLDIDRRSAEATANEVVARGGSAVALEADATNVKQYESAVKQAVAEMGGVTGLVCNVASFGTKTLAATTVDVWDRVYATNVRSAFIGTQAVLPFLPSGASLVYIASTAGVRAGSGSPAYDSSKAAMIGLMKSAALELGPMGIRVNVIAPGPIDTPMSRDYHGGSVRESSQLLHIPLRRVGTSWELAYATLFLLSDDATFVTGQVLEVEGGAMLPRGVQQQLVDGEPGAPESSSVKLAHQ